MHKRNPVSRDPRYTVEKEYCGHEKPQWVARFCGDWIGSSPFYQSAVILAVGHNARRMGAFVIEAETH